MKHPVLFFSLILVSQVSVAQVDESPFQSQMSNMREEFDQFKRNARQQFSEERRKAEADFAAFRKKANEEFAAAVERAWREMSVQPAEPKPKEPEPPKPPAPVPNRIPTTVQLPQAQVTPTPAKPQVVPPPAVPEADAATPTMQFAYYGVTCDVHTSTDGLGFRLAAVDEKSVAAAWKTLSQEKYDGLLHDCIAQRDALHLSDWGYMRLLGSMSERLLGKGSNEAVLLQMYLLAQSGYRVRMARTDSKLVLLMPFSNKIYSYSYLTIDNVKHYLITHDKLQNLRVCEVKFPREQVADIRMGQLPTLGGAKRSCTLAAENFGVMRATVAVEERLAAFLNDYPLSDSWEYYALAGLSDGVKATLYPALKKQMEGKSKKKAAAMLLDFVQTAFDYATDQDQFGYERPLFGDESFYYRKNDCEDRSILYSILVRDLLGLDVVLVHWPGHLGTAVAFPDAVEGDYFVVDGRRYTVCDPTYIGAGIGETMPKFKNASANLVRL